MNRPLHLLAALSFVFYTPAFSAESPIVLSDYAGAADTCIAVYDPVADQHLVHNPEQCMKRLSPCSTFKIPNALIGLETGVLRGAEDLKTWDGTRYQREVNNRDHDLASAIRHSVVWYFREVARDVGPERMQDFLDSFDYGNRDISGGQQGFWLSSSLRISAFEQIRFLSALEAGSLPVSRENQALVESMLHQKEHLPDDFPGALYGKTGSCVGKTADHGWFTGYYRRNGQRYVFAVNVVGVEQWGWQAREIAVNVLLALP